MPPPGEPLEVLVSQQGLVLQPDPDGEAWVLGREFLGREWLYQVQCGELKLRLRLPLQTDHSRGLRCRLALRPGEPARLFPSGQELVAVPKSPQVL
jgi:iron(III) transport system ATP-binding protein